MNKGTKLRFKIHNILYDIYQNNKNLDDLIIKNEIDKESSEDIAFVHNVCLNSMRFYFHVNEIINTYIKKKSKIHQKILLISGITQIVYLNFKEYAVIDCSVEIAKKLNIYHGLINACLKNISLNKKDLNKTNIKFNNLPYWFQKQTTNLSKINKNSFLKNFNQEPDLHIVFKDEKKKEQFKEKIVNSSNNSGFLKQKKLIRNLSFYKEGHWWVQDFSSSFPLLNVNKKVLSKNNIDLCAAPGGKSFQVLSTKNTIILNDKSKKRLKITKENLNRLNFKAEILNKNALTINSNKKFDFIILDAPCSAIGTIRKNPEIFFKNKDPDFKNLIYIQMKMLKKASILLKNNGIILYMVCSFLEIETTNQIKHFLSKNKNFTLNKFFVNNHNDQHKKFINNNYMYTLPSTFKGYKIDGYFAAYLKKVNR